MYLHKCMYICVCKAIKRCGKTIAIMKNSTISNAALNRIITAQKGQGFGKWVLNFSVAQAKAEGLTEKQISDAHQTFCDYHATVNKAEMIEVVYAAIVG